MTRSHNHRHGRNNRRRQLLVTQDFHEPISTEPQNEYLVIKLIFMIITIVIAAFIEFIFYSYQLTEINDSMQFVQKLNHFNSNDTRTWLQKYQMYCDHYDPLKPILLIIGPQDDHVFNIKMLTKEYPLIEYNSMILQIDQRYYSNSFITSDSTGDNLNYLNIEQEMEDIKTFKLYIESKYQLTPNKKWILCGQGYAGSLAMWLRMNNPDLFFAALSYRGSLTRKLVYTGFHDVAYKALSNYDSSCVNQIIRGIRDLQFSLESDRGALEIHEKFKLCDSPNKILEKEKKQLLVSLRKSFVHAVQYNHSSTFNIKYVCDIMGNWWIGNSESRLAYVTLKKLEYDNLSCLKNSFDNVVYRKSTLSSELTVENDDHFEIVKKSLSDYKAECVAQIKDAEEKVVFNLGSVDRSTAIKNKFRLCETPNKNTESSKQCIFENIRNLIDNAVMFNGYPNESSMAHVCDIMKNKSIGTEESRLAFVTLKKLEYDNLSCLKNSFDNVVNRKSTLSSELTLENDDHFEIVKKSLSDYKAECVARIKDAEENVVFNLGSVNRSTVIKNKFRLCDTPNKNNESSKQSIFENIRNVIDNAVIFNGYPNESSMAHVSDIMKNKSIGTELDTMSKISWREHTYMNNNDSSYMYRHKLTSSDQQYLYQMCTEKGFFSTGFIDGDFCGQILPKTYVEDICSDVFGKSFNFSNLEKDIEKINNLTTKIKDNRILNIQVFSDPWHKQGLFENNLEYVDTVLIEKDMYNTWQMAKTEIEKAIMKWLSIDECELGYICFDD